MIRIRVLVRVLKSGPWTLIYPSLLNKGVGPKTMIPISVTCKIGFCSKKWIQFYFLTVKFPKK